MLKVHFRLLLLWLHSLTHWSGPHWIYWPWYTHRSRAHQANQSYHRTTRRFYLSRVPCYSSMEIYVHLLPVYHPVAWMLEVAPTGSTCIARRSIYLEVLSVIRTSSHSPLSHMACQCNTFMSKSLSYSFFCKTCSTSLHIMLGTKAYFYIQYNSSCLKSNNLHFISHFHNHHISIV